jgi:hypothetical protein
MARRNRTPSSALTEAGQLDVAVCESARVNRDRRYDGLFSPAFAHKDLLQACLSCTTSQGEERSASSCKSLQPIFKVKSGVVRDHEKLV